MGEKKTGSLRMMFDRQLKLEFHGAKVVRHARYVTFQIAEVAIPRRLFATILSRIRRLCPVPT